MGVLAPTAIYLIKNEWSEANFKIGMSNQPVRRSYEIEENYKVSPKIISSCWFPTTGTARKAETIWHRRFDLNRTDDHGGREWFSLSQNDVSEFLSWSELSMSVSDLRDWLFKDAASPQAIQAYKDKLFGAIPKRKHRRWIDVWQDHEYINPDYRLDALLESYL